MRRIYSRILLISLYGLIVMTMGCTSIPLSRGITASPELLVTLHLDTVSYYYPGEAVICTVRLINLTESSLTLQMPNAVTMSFWQGIPEGEKVRKVEPVYSKEEPMSNTVSADAYQYIERIFVFPQLTETSGTFTLHSIYEGFARRKPDESPYRVQGISQPVIYEVKGVRQFDRDREGIIRKDDAIDLIREKIEYPLQSCRADLVIDEAGFLNWWITYVYIDSDGKEVNEAYLVNPYLGTLRYQVPPYKEGKEEEMPPKPFKPYQRFGNVPGKQ